MRRIADQIFFYLLKIQFIQFIILTFLLLLLEINEQYAEPETQAATIIRLYKLILSFNSHPINLISDDQPPFQQPFAIVLG